MIKRILIIVFILLVVLLITKPNFCEKVAKITSPIEILLENGDIIKLKELDSFDSYYSQKNSDLAQKFAISENEAFVIGSLAKYWTQNILLSRKVKVINGDIVYNRQNYRIKFENSPFCIKNGRISNKASFEKQLESVRKGNYIILDLDSDTAFPISKDNANFLKNYIVVRKSHIKNFVKNKNSKTINSIIIEPTPIPKQTNYISKLDLGNIKIIVSDSTSKTRPDRNCSSNICKEILYKINHTQNTLDMAIYGYSSTPDIEKALQAAINRGVKIRMVYDIDSKGNNIYPDTEKFIKLISDNKNDKDSSEVNNTMHNKFYIFDGSSIITGSANLSHTDMSGYNSNAIIVIESKEIAKFYENEFNQMYAGRFHNNKNSNPNKTHKNITVFFSPQDKSIRNGILPLIRNAKKYIYVPSFVITEKNFVSELINAKNRGVDVKIIVDSLNANNNSSKHKELRSAGIPVKAENYAGKMHSKTIVIDDEYLILGSMNFSSSGENRNDENLVILKDSRAAKFYKDFFIYQWSRIPDKWLKYVPRAEGRDSVDSCYDGIDNNYDGFKDSEDPACK